MKLKRFLLRYFPPGIILEYETKDQTRSQKEVDLLNLTPQYVMFSVVFCMLKQSHSINTHYFFLHSSIQLWSRSDVEVMIEDIIAREPLVSENRKPQLRRLIYKLIEKLETNEVWTLFHHSLFDKLTHILFNFSLIHIYFSIHRTMISTCSRFCELIFSLLPIARLIKVEISLLRVLMIELASYGILRYVFISNNIWTYLFSAA